MTSERRYDSITRNLRIQAPKLKREELSQLAELLEEMEELKDACGLKQVITDAAARLARLAQG